MFLIADFISDNSLLLAAVLVMLVFATGYGLYTRQGSGISKHPRSDSIEPDLPEKSTDGAEPNDGAGISKTPDRELTQRGVE